MADEISEKAWESFVQANRYVCNTDRRSFEAGRLAALEEALKAVDKAYRAESDGFSPAYQHGLYDARAIVRALAEGDEK